jgi:hypothetical protein
VQAISTPLPEETPLPSGEDVARVGLGRPPKPPVRPSAHVQGEGVFCYFLTCLVFYYGFFLLMVFSCLLWFYQLPGLRSIL